MFYTVEEGFFRNVLHSIFGAEIAIKRDRNFSMPAFHSIQSVLLLLQMEHLVFYDAPQL